MMQFWAVWMDGWYGTKEIMLTIERYGKIYYCPLKDNRRVDALEWTEAEKQHVRAFLSGIQSPGGEPRFVYKTGTADLNIVAPVWQCPALVYGPGDSSLDHTTDEHISLEEYLKSVLVLREALMGLLSK